MLVLRNMSIYQNEVFMGMHNTTEGVDSQKKKKKRWMAKYIKDDLAIDI